MDRGGWKKCCVSLLAALAVPAFGSVSVDSRAKTIQKLFQSSALLYTGSTYVIIVTSQQLSLHLHSNVAEI